jgi:type IV pilus assembly protein PilV
VPDAQTQRGFSLIEILVALFVLAIGLLGMAGLQATAQRVTADSGNLGRATRAAHDMADRIRLEIDASLVETFVTASASNQSSYDSASCYSTSGCTGSTRVTADVAEWQRLLAAQLPGGQGIVCRDASPYDDAGPSTPNCSGSTADPLVVKVWWQARDLARQAASGVVTQRYVAVVGL